MNTIDTIENLEAFAQNLKQNIPSLPENLRLLIIMNSENFNNLAEKVGITNDKFIYNTNAGIEFGIKKEIIN